MDSRGTERDTGQGRADASLDAILQCVALPVWVVDHAGVVVLANPAAVATLGYDDASELRGRHGHDAVHYKHPDGSPFPRENCPLLSPMRTGEPVHCDEDWLVRRDGRGSPSRSPRPPPTSRPGAASS